MYIHAHYTFKKSTPNRNCFGCNKPKSQAKYKTNAVVNNSPPNLTQQNRTAPKQQQQQQKQWSNKVRPKNTQCMYPHTIYAAIALQLTYDLFAPLLYTHTHCCTN